MDLAQPERREDLLSFLFAGLQAGMMGALWMLVWLGASATWQRSSFWTAENLMASLFYGPAAIRSGFSTSTLVGIALYLLIYSMLGCCFAAGFRKRLPRPQLVLAGILLAVGWYYVSFHGFWTTLNPLVALLHAERPTLLGHVFYGAVIARYPRYLNSEPVSEQQTSDQDSDSQVVMAKSEKNPDP